MTTAGKSERAWASRVDWIARKRVLVVVNDRKWLKKEVCDTVTCHMYGWELPVRE